MSIREHQQYIIINEKLKIINKTIVLIILTMEIVDIDSLRVDVDTLCEDLTDFVNDVLTNHPVEEQQEMFKKVSGESDDISKILDILVSINQCKKRLTESSEESKNQEI
jgi:hypothetical protein